MARGKVMVGRSWGYYRTYNTFREKSIRKGRGPINVKKKKKEKKKKKKKKKEKKGKKKKKKKRRKKKKKKKNGGQQIFTTDYDKSEVFRWVFLASTQLMGRQGKDVNKCSQLGGPGRV